MRKKLSLLLGVAILMPNMVMAQYINGGAMSLTQSPAYTVSAAMFPEPADLYLNPLGFGGVTDPIFMLKLKTGTGNPIGSVNDPYEIGLGSWFGGIYGAAYYGFDGATTGLIGGVGGKSVNESQSDTLITSADGKTLTGKSSLITKQVDYTTYELNNPILLAGFKLGIMQIGVKDSLLLRTDKELGSFDESGVLQTASTTKIMDSAGVVSYLDSTDYALGYKANTANGNSANTTVKNNLLAGLTMPLGNMTFRGQFGFIIDSNDMSTLYGVETKKIQTGAGYAAYTPTAALPGNTAAAISDLQKWTIKLVNSVNAPTTIAPSLAASIEMPLDFNGNSASVSGGLEYTLQANSYSASLQDETGAALKVGGTGSYSHSASYESAINSGTKFVETTKKDTRMYTADAYTADSTNTISLPLSFKVEPNEDFRFAIGFKPEASFGKTSYNETGKTVVTTVFDNGDGVTDASDYTSVQTTVSQPFTTTVSKTSVKFNFGSGVQIYLKPKVLRLNLGASAITTLVNRTETVKSYTGLQTSSTTKTDGSGVSKVTTSSASTVPQTLSDSIADAGANTSVYYMAGLTYILNPNVNFDFFVKNNRAFNLADTTANGGFLNLNNYTILLTIKLPPQK